MEKSLKQIALELLKKYEENRKAVIAEFSFDISKSEEALKKEVEDYKRAIESANQ